MLFDIQLVKSTSMFCVESAAATVARWLNRDYEMMFAKMWGFGFSPGNRKIDEIVGMYLSAENDINDAYKMLEEYHGIRIKKTILEQYTLLVNAVADEIEKGMPVLICISKSCCPWLENNRDGEPAAFLLVIGFEGKNGWYCLDVHNGFVDTKWLPVNNLLCCMDNSVEIKYFTFQVVADERKDITLKDFICCLKTADSLAQDPFNSMRLLAEYIENSIDFEAERCGIENPYYIPLLINIMHVTRARKLLSSTLYYIGNICNDGLIYNLSSEFLLLGGEWNSVWNMLNKAYCIPKYNNRDICKRMGHKIRKIADMEESLINSIIGNYYNEKERKYVLRDVLVNQSLNNLLYLSINSYFNNKAFAEANENKECANFTSHGEYFLTEGLPENRIITALGMRFMLCIYPNQYDNISCRKQSMEISPGFYKRIMILGCSEWGDGFGNIDILYSDNHCESLLIHFSDWFINGASEIPIAWTGKIIGLNNNKEERSLFALSFELNCNQTIKKIQLPENPNIHIFSISLEKIM